MLIIIYLIVVLLIIPLFLVIITLLHKLFSLNANTNYFDVLNYLCIKLLNTKHTFVNNNKFLNKGIILSNHRSFFDFPFDNYITGACVISRKEVQWGMLFAGLLQVIENRVIRISRGQTSREHVYNQVDKYLQENNLNVLLYPEGTRSKHLILNTIEDVQKTMKPGLLKSIYENKTYPVQIFISTNKEEAINEKKLSIKFGVKVNSIVGNIIHPKNFKSFDEFYNEVCSEWLLLWNKVYSY